MWSNNATQLLISDPGQPQLTRQKNCWSIKLFVGGRWTGGRRPELVYQNILDLVSASEGEHVNNITHRLIVQCLARREANHSCSEVNQCDVDLQYYMRPIKV